MRLITRFYRTVPRLWSLFLLSGKARWVQAPLTVETHDVNAGFVLSDDTTGSAGTLASEQLMSG